MAKYVPDATPILNAHAISMVSPAPAAPGVYFIMADNCGLYTTPAALAALGRPPVAGDYIIIAADNSMIVMGKAEFESKYQQVM